MYFQVASKLVVTNSGGKQYSQAVDMAGGNAIYVEATAFNITSGSLRLTVQEGNDLENWSDVTVANSTLTFTAANYGTLKVTSIAAQYVRLVYEQATSGTGIVGAGVNVANL